MFTLKLNDLRKMFKKSPIHRKVFKKSPVHQVTLVPNLNLKIVPLI